MPTRRYGRRNITRYAELPMEEEALRLDPACAGARNPVAPSAKGRRWSAVRYADEAEAGRRVFAQRAVDQDAPR